MTNVFTRKTRFPRTTTLLDYRLPDFDYDIKPLRLLSPTRRGNPHPQGLNHQSIPNRKDFLIWNPDFARKSEKYPEMVNHTRFVNFSCKHQEKYNYVKSKDKLPDIRYTENTISRRSYVSPSRYGNLAPDYNAQKVCHSPDKKAVTGIVPNLIVPQYLPVIEK